MSQGSHVADKQELEVSTSDSDNQPILEITPNKRERGRFLNQDNVAEVFPELDIGTLCKLTEMEDIRPSTVLELVPGTSRAQMGAFLQIAEDLKNKVIGGGRNELGRLNYTQRPARAGSV